MTSQQEKIQSLIADIERALGSEKPRKPWIKSSEIEPQRQALARVKDYLRSLQQAFDAPGGWGPVDPSTGQIASQWTGESGGDASDVFADRASTTPLSEESAEKVLQSLLTEMKFLKTSALEPLRLEMDSLRQARDSLQHEVKALDEQRSAGLEALQQDTQGSMPSGQVAMDDQQLNQFLQVLMARLQERLSVQVSQTLAQLTSDHSAAMAQLSAADAQRLQLQPSDQMEQLRQLQARSEQLLLNIDSTLQGMFDTLKQNIDSYQLSLNEGLENMHSLGLQGEVIVRSLVDHLTQQLGQASPAAPVLISPRNALVEDPTDLAEGEGSGTGTSSEVPEMVASLNDILIEASAPTAEQVQAPQVPQQSPSAAAGVNLANVHTSAAESAGDSVGEAAGEASALCDELASALGNALGDDLAGDVAEVRPEDCIREDGTIDLDLLKLDIDRSDGDAELTRDELMIDAAIADAHVAAAESEDPEIEAKVTPTADAVYLADLTLEDLIIDSSLAEATDDEATDDEATDDEVADDEVAEEGNTDGALIEDSIEDSSAEKLDSALMPDLPDVDDLVEDASDEIDDALSDDLIRELEVVSQQAEQTAIEMGGRGLDVLLPDLEEVVVFEANVPQPQTLTEEAMPLESAFIPDRPGDRDSLQNGLETVGEATAQDLESATALAVDSMAADAFDTTFQELESDLLRDDEFRGAEADLTTVLSQIDSRIDAIQVDQIDPMAPPTDHDLGDDPEAADEFAELSLLIDPSVEPSADLPVTEAGDSEDSAPIEEPPPFVSTEENSDPWATPEAELDRLPLPHESLDEPFNESFNEFLDEGDDEGDDDPTDGQPAHWFLGLDLGTTGLSAVLMNQLGDQVYPLCWNVAGDSESNRFRLPVVVQVNSRENQLGIAGPAALQRSDEYLRNLKPLLKIGIPNGASGEPWVQWSDQVAFPLMSVQVALNQLLETLSGDRTRCRAVGLKKTALRRALADLKGVIVGYPHNWPDTYSFNIREAILAARLVPSAAQVSFVDEAIAALLSALPDPQVASESLDNQQPGLYNCNWSGGTVVISAGSTLSEAAIADLPADLHQLSYNHFALRSFTYAGDSIDQDIVCQLLHLPVQAKLNVRRETTPLEWSGGAAPDAPAETMGEENFANCWQSIGLAQLKLPQSGEADRIRRHRLRQCLNNSSLGRQALAAARDLKLALQESDELELTLGDQTWTITSKDLENKVFLPYIQRINRQLNGLLSQKGISTQAVNQVVCTGGSASLGAIARWLRQKFPNATIIQDTYNGEYSNSCSRVAYGLANLCHYPHVLDVNRHQYSDYFLLLELLRVLPEQPLPAGGILHLLEQRGINTQVCQAHILALIEGHLPPGLVPTEGDRPMISAQSPDIDTYRVLAELPLFRKQGGQIYIADHAQGQRLRAHLEAILATKAQALNEPLTVQLLSEWV